MNFLWSSTTPRRRNKCSCLTLLWLTSKTFYQDIKIPWTRITTWKTMKLRRGRSHLSLIMLRLPLFHFWTRMDSDNVSVMGWKRENAQIALLDSIKTFIFFLDNCSVLSRDRVRKFGMPIFKGIKGSTMANTNQSIKSNLSVENLWSKVVISKKQGSTWPSRYYCLIYDNKIGQAILKEMENLINIIMYHIKYLESQQLRNMKAVSDR